MSTRFSNRKPEKKLEKSSFFQQVHRSLWKKKHLRPPILFRGLCFRTHSSLSERSKSICEWMTRAVEWPTGALISICFPLFPQIYENELRYFNLFYPILPMGSPWIGTSLVHMTTALTSERITLAASWTYLRPSSVMDLGQVTNAPKYIKLTLMHHTDYHRQDQQIK